MYDYFKGILTDKRKTAKGTFVSIEVAGIGYLLEVTERDFICIETSDSEKTKFYVSLIHREDSMNLFGFSNKETRDIFQILLSVSGVGAKMALALLNEFDACDLISLVIDGNFKELTRAKGVGPKLAQKIVLELKDKLINWQKIAPVDISGMEEEKDVAKEALSDAQAVLLSLGYSTDEVKAGLKFACKKATKKDSSEEILKEALSYLAQD